MAHLHRGGLSALGSGGDTCPLCHERGHVIGTPCTVCGASMDPPALGPAGQEQPGQTRMLADRVDPCLVRPLSIESSDGRVELSDDTEE
eukprot:2183473-Alexandrium_andersonii.AAC.1